MTQKWEDDETKCFKELYLTRLEELYSAGNMSVLLDGLMCCADHIPPWLFMGLSKNVMYVLTHAPGTRGKTGTFFARYQQDSIDAGRYRMVRECRRRGFKGEDAFEEAHRLLAATSRRGGYSVDAVRQSYKRVKRVIKGGEVEEHPRYAVLLWPEFYRPFLTGRTKWSAAKGLTVEWQVKNGRGLISPKLVP